MTKLPVCPSKKNKGSESKNTSLQGIYRVLLLIVVASLATPVFFSPAKADPLLYPLYGYASSCDDTPAYQGATVTIVNVDTGVVKYDTTEDDGYFMVTFNNLMGSTEWVPGDTLMIWVNGTGIYKEWRGKEMVLCDEDTVPHQVNVTLCPPSTNRPGPPQHLQASLGFNDGLYWIHLQWDPPQGLDSNSPVTYRIYRGTIPGEKIFLGSTTGDRVFNDTDLPFNMTYHYCITAHNTGGESISSPLVYVTTRLSPTAQFSIQPPRPHPNESILFVDSSRDPDGILINWTWQITPGGTLYGTNVSYLFSHPGTYTVTLTVTDTTGDQDTSSLTFSLSAPSDDTPGFDLLILLLSLTSLTLLQKKRRLG